MTEQAEKYEIIEAIEADVVNLGTLRTAGPLAVIRQASAVAEQLAEIVNSRRLYSTISGRKYVKVEGWTTLGAMLGVVPREVETHPIDNGYESTVELVRANDGAVIGRGSAICTRDERNWSSRDDFAVRSMAITRATGKAYRLGFSWVMALAGYEPTPAEEMDGVEPHRPRQSQRIRSTRVKSNGGNGRPWDPVTLKDKMQQSIAQKREQGFSFPDGKADNFRGATRSNLEMCFAGDEHSDQKRHLVSEYLTGKASSADWDDAEIKAFHGWLNASKDLNTGEWYPDKTAVIEARAVARQAQKDAGQQEMEL